MACAKRLHAWGVEAHIILTRPEADHAGATAHQLAALSQVGVQLNQADQAVTLDARAEILKKAEALAMGDQPVIPLLFPVKANLVADYVKGWKDNPLDLHPSRYIWLDMPASDDTEPDSDTPAQEGG